MCSVWAEAEVGVHSIAKCNNPRSFMFWCHIVLLSALAFVTTLISDTGTKTQSCVDKRLWITVPCFSSLLSNKSYVKVVTLVLIQVSWKFMNPPINCCCWDILAYFIPTNKYRWCLMQGSSGESCGEDQNLSPEETMSELMTLILQTLRIGRDTGLKGCLIVGNWTFVFS